MDARSVVGTGFTVAMVNTLQQCRLVDLRMRVSQPLSARILPLYVVPASPPCVLGHVERIVQYVVNSQTRDKYVPAAFHGDRDGERAGESRQVKSTCHQYL